MQPAVAIDATGKVHVAATAVENVAIWYATNATGKWVTQQVVAQWSEVPDAIGIVEQPSIAVDPSDGSVWIAFSHWSCADCATSPGDGIYQVNNAAGSWSDPVQLTNGCDLHSSLAVRGGRVYLACATDDDYVNPPNGAVMFGTDASGAWVLQRVAQRGALPHLVLDAEGRAGILFTASELRYARQKSNVSFAIERLPGTADGAEWMYSVLTVDAGSGDQWAAHTRYTTGGDWAVFLAKRGAEGWSNPFTAIPGGDLIGLSVRDGVVQVTAARESTLVYASNGSGAFVEQVVGTPGRFWWGRAAFAVLPTGRPIVVFTGDGPSRSSGIWILKGPAI